MVLTLENPFLDPTVGIDRTVNPFVDRLLDGQKDGTLNLAFGPDLANYQNYWRTKYKHSPKELILEIGCHNGDFLNSLAKNNPDKGFIGIDITYKRTVLTAEKAKISKNKNIISVLANATHLKRLFHRHELSGIILLFPDPWNKKRRQKKNRLINRQFCHQLAEVLHPSGFIWIKTDEPEYFSQISTFLSQETFVRSRYSLPQELTGKLPPSTFEEQFIKFGLPIFSGLWHKSFVDGAEKWDNRSQLPHLPN